MRAMTLAAFGAVAAGPVAAGASAMCAIEAAAPRALPEDTTATLTLHGTGFEALNNASVVLDDGTAVHWAETSIVEDKMDELEDSAMAVASVPAGTFQEGAFLRVRLFDGDTLACELLGSRVFVHGNVTLLSHEELEPKSVRPGVYNIEAERKLVFRANGLFDVSQGEAWVRYRDLDGNDLQVTTAGLMEAQGGESVLLTLSPVLPKPVDWTFKCEDESRPVRSETCVWDIRVQADVTVNGGASYSNALELTFGYEAPLRIAFLYVGKVNDFGWTHQFDVARVSMQGKYGGEIDASTYFETVVEGNYEGRQTNKKKTLETNTPVPEFWEDGTPNRYYPTLKLMKQLCDEDFDLVVAASTGLMDQSIDVTNGYPGCRLEGDGTATDAPERNTFFINTGFMTTPRLSTAFSKIYQARYLTGLVAGHEMQKRAAKAALAESQEDKDEILGDACVGYIAAYPNPQVSRGINAFTLGCREIYPECTVKVAWMGTWNNNRVEGLAAKFMWNRGGCRVVTQHSVTTEPQIYYMEKGGAGIGYNSDAKKLVGDSVLTSAILNWEPVLSYFVEQITRGEWRPDDRDPAKGGSRFAQQQVWLGLDDYAARLAPYFSPRVERSIQDSIMRRFEELSERKGADAFHNIFCGNIKKRWHMVSDPVAGGARAKGCGGQPVWERLDEPGTLNPQHFWGPDKTPLGPVDAIGPDDCLFGVDFAGQALLASPYPLPHDELRVFNDFLVEGVELFEPQVTMYGTIHNDTTHGCATSYGSSGDRFFTGPVELPRCDGTHWNLTKGECNPDLGVAQYYYAWKIDSETGEEMRCSDAPDEVGVYSQPATLPEAIDPDGNPLQATCVSAVDTLPITIASLGAGVIVLAIVARKIRNGGTAAGDVIASPIAGATVTMTLLLGSALADILSSRNFVAAADPKMVHLVVPFVTLTVLQVIISTWACRNLFSYTRKAMRAVTSRRKSTSFGIDTAESRQKFIDAERANINNELRRHKVSATVFLLRDIPAITMTFAIIFTSVQTLESPAFALSALLRIVTATIGATKLPMLRKVQNERAMLEVLALDTTGGGQEALVRHLSHANVKSPLSPSATNNKVAPAPAKTMA